jgi:hypothetical protein
LKREIEMRKKKIRRKVSREKNALMGLLDKGYSRGLNSQTMAFLEAKTI